MNPARKTYIDPKELPRVERATLRRILATLAPYRSRVALVVLAILASSLLNLLPPFFVKRAVDQAIPAGDLRLLLLLCAGMVVGPVLAGLVGVLQKHLTTSTSETLMRDLRVRMFEHFQGLPYSYFVHARPGEAIAAVISDVQGVGSVVATTLVDVLDGIVVFTTTAAVLVYFDWRLALVTLALLPLFVVPTRSVGRERKRMRRSAQARAAELVGILDEALSASGILLARVFGAERFEAARLREKAGEIAELSLRQAMVGRWFRLLIGLFEAVAPALVFGFGGLLVMRHGLALGTLVAFATQLRRLYAAASSLTTVHVDLVSSYAYFERVFRVLDMPPEETPSGGLRPPLRGALQLQNVSFAYEDGVESLSHVDLAVEPGQCVAVVGPSGAGKSTLVSLLLRLHDPTSGEIRLDGHDLRSLDRGWLRAQVGVVTQETYLFHDTVLANLLYARPEASRAQVEAAARAAQVHDFIASLPLGYDTVVGRRGFRLSGGERQRVAIARVILKDPRILILDEATSSLDSRNEQLIQAALDPLLAGRTSLVIAHRFSTIRRASLIAVFDHGHLREKGTHDELLARGGLYAQLYKGQLHAAPVT